MKNLSEELTKEYMNALDAFEIQIKRKMQNQSYSGARKSNAKGSSLEFSDFRPYFAGDDFRRVDWNSYARFDKLFIKQFMEEKQAHIHVFLDTSFSMSEHEDKCFYMKMLGASIAYLALKNTDKLSIYTCADRILSKKTELQSKNRFAEVVSFLDQLQFEPNTKLTASIKDLLKQKLPSGLCILISDFFSEDGYEDALKYLQNRNQDVILVQLLSEEERNPSIEGMVRFIDSESKEYLDLELTESVVNQYKMNLRQYEKNLKEFCFKRGAKFVGLTTKTPSLKGVYEIGEL